jgi:hypothetical protein
MVAAKVGAEQKQVSHIAVLAANGITQLYDLVETARKSGQLDGENIEAERCVDVIRKTIGKIRANPDDSNSFAWGHPYSRWASFLETSTLDELLRCQSRIYVAHGVHDEAVPVASFDVMVAELLRRGRDVTIERRVGANHSFQDHEHPAETGLISVFRNVVEWFVGQRPGLLG